MSLLREIQAAAISMDSRVTDLLRKCKVLAARLGSEELDKWVDQELNGYKSKEELPDYRKLSLIESKGHFQGYFGQSLRNASIPPSCIPKKFREFIKTEYLGEGIGVYEDLLKDGEDQFQVNWPPDLVAHCGTKIYEDMNCLAAWKVIPRGSIIRLVDNVRNRILAFALEIEKKNPDAGDAPGNSQPVPSGEVSQIFHTHIYGNVGNFSSGSQNVSQTVNNITGDISSLQQALKKLGVEDADIEELTSSLAEDEKQEGKSIGKKTSGWIGKMVSKAASGLSTITMITAGQVIPKLIMQYLGLPPAQ